MSIKVFEGASLPEASAAKYLGMSQSWLRRKRIEGDGPTFVKLGRSVRYLLEDLNNFMLKNRRNNTLKGGI